MARINEETLSLFERALDYGQQLSIYRVIIVPRYQVWPQNESVERLGASWSTEVDSILQGDITTFQNGFKLLFKSGSQFVVQGTPQPVNSTLLQLAIVNLRRPIVCSTVTHKNDAFPLNPEKSSGVTQP